MSTKYERGTLTTLMSSSTEWTSDGLENTSAALGAEFDNSDANNLWLWADFELSITFATAPTDRSTVDLYLIPAINGTDYCDSVTTEDVAGRAPANCLKGSFELRNITTVLRVPLNDIKLSPVKFKPLVINRSGQTIPNTSTLKMLPYRMQ